MVQKQYANNKELYQQKVNALYKKEGYSALGSCLPTIITLVIFIVVLRSFSDYSVIQNRKYIYDMAESYNEVILDSFDLDGDFLKIEHVDNQNKLVINGDKVLQEMGTDEYKELPMNVEGKTGVVMQIRNIGNGDYTVKTTNSYITATFNISSTDEGVKSYVQNSFTADANVLRANTSLTVGGKTFAEYEAADGTAENFVKEMQEEAAANTFRSEIQGLTIFGLTLTKNIWKPDAIYALRSCTSAYYVTSIIDNDTEVLSDEDYVLITEKLDVEKSQSNGYYVLIALTILSTLLTQIVTMRSQKDQMELQSVDGQAANSQKMMLWMMPIMMAVFAFIYTAAFSIYIILSTLLSLLSTLLINKLVVKQ
ncbi:MAG: YidC/Oxa1 family membrane protein insertase, partial [Clostridia bacterium]|nr:YidC/Oxa1 family membrane protein insertase [Clostridia bacterium]